MAPAIERDRFIERLFDAGIGCSVHYIPLHLHPYWRDRYALTAGRCSRTAQQAYERMLSLPLYTRMSDADVQRVVDAVRAALRLTVDDGQARVRPAGRRPGACCCCRRCCWPSRWRSSSIRAGRCSSASSASAATACRFASTSSARMVADAPQRGPALTVGDDPRITRVGAWLRRTRLDELPQLIDVLPGHMSLVGPRPEVPRYVAQYPAALREQVLSVRPGITDPASLRVPRREPSCWRAPPTPSASTSRSSCRASCTVRPTMRRRPPCAPTCGVLLRTLRLLVQR